VGAQTVKLTASRTFISSNRWPKNPRNSHSREYRSPWTGEIS